MLRNFIISNSDTTEKLLRGPQAARGKLGNYIVTLFDFSVASCAAVKHIRLITISHLKLL